MTELKELATSNSNVDKDTSVDEKAVSKSRHLQHLTKNQLVIILLGLVVLVFAKVWSPDLDHRRHGMVFKFWWSTTSDWGLSEGWDEEPIRTVKWEAYTKPEDFPTADCGYIVVPKDYYDPRAGTAKIALGQYRSSTQPSKGTLLFDPGGPGVPGKPFVTRHANLLQLQTGNDYDIVGFDPRGVGESEPKLQCFAYAPGREYTIRPFFNYATFMQNSVLEQGYDFPSNRSIEEIRQILIPQQREAGAAQKMMGSELKYMGTSTVVRDMEFITTHLDGEGAPINFIGGSYGSILG